MNENKDTLINPEDTIEWNSFCFKMNKAFCKFFVQVAISFMVLSLSTYKIIVLDENNDKSLYVSLLTLIMGVYLPQPSIK